MRIVVVGMNPSTLPGGPTGVSRKKSTFDRLHKWMDYLNVKNFSFVNCYHYSGDVKKMRVDKTFLNTCVKDYDIVISLGNVSHDILKMIGKSSFKLPHPSPRNRVLNNKEYEKNVLEECKNYISGVC
jgi:hypothetical protein